MIDNGKMSRREFDGAGGEMCQVCETLHKAAEVIETADRTPDEAVKKPLLDGARTMLQNVIDALDGRRTEGLVEPGEDDD